MQIINNGAEVHVTTKVINDFLISKGFVPTRQILGMNVFEITPELLYLTNQTSFALKSFVEDVRKESKRKVN